jgi:serine/threonine-protein kinase
MSTNTGGAPVIAGKYHLLRKLGAGGMAEVFLARQAGLEGFEKLVVVKRILPHLAMDEEFVTMFLDEARTAADLRHPNVVNIFEVGEDRSTFYMAMEFLHGQDIRKIQRTSAKRKELIPVQQACQIVLDAANGLHYAHTKSDLSGTPLNIVHRDISPQNVLVTYDGATKIVDFGIAKAATQDTNTATGVIKGKYTYMSPEQAMGEDIDHRSDQFALGVVFWELLTMRRLFKRGGEMATLNAIIEGDIPPPTKFVDIPEHLEHIVLQALQRDPDKRFDSCQDMMMELEDFLAQEGLVHSPARLGKYMRDIFAEAIAEEADLGIGQLDGESFSVNSLPGDMMTTPGRKSGAERSRSRSRSALGVPDEQQSAHDAPTSLSRSRGSRSKSLSLQVDVVDDHDEPVTQLTPPPEGLSRESTVDGAPALGADHTGQSMVTATRGPDRGSRLGLMAAAAVVVLLLLGGVAAAALWPEDPRRGTLTLKTDPPGARIFLDGADTGRTTPHIFRELHVDKPHSAKVELEGYASDEISFTFSPEVPIQDLSLELSKTEVVGKVTGDVTGEPTPVKDPSDPPPPEDPKDPKDPKDGDAVVKADPPKEPPKKVVPKKPGRLKVVAKPWAHVFVDGEKLGTTPFAPKVIPAGTYKVKLVNPDLKKSTTKTVRVRPGRTASVRVVW